MIDCGLGAATRRQSTNETENEVSKQKVEPNWKGRNTFPKPINTLGLCPIGS